MLDIKKELFMISNNSPALKRKVGAIITNSKCTKILATGMNYNLTCNSACCENLDGETFDTVIHAEADALSNLFKSGINSGKLAIYVTYSPCIECCKKIVSSGIIKYLYYYEEHPVNFRNAENTKGSMSPLEFLLNAGIKVYKFDSNMNKFIEQKPTKSIGICHSADSDGFMCSFLLGKFYPDMKIYGYNYEIDKDWMHVIAGNYIFADVCPPINWLNQNIERFRNHQIHITIYDHHKKTIADVKNWLSYNKISELCYKFIESDDESHSAAKILYDWILAHLKKDVKKFQNIEFIVNAISLYDTWHFKNDLLTLEQKQLGYSELKLVYLSELFKGWGGVETFNLNIGLLFYCKTKKRQEKIIKKFIDDGCVLANAKQAETLIWLNSAISLVVEIKNTEILFIFGTRKPDYYVEKYCKRIARQNSLNKIFPQVTYMSFYINLQTQKVIFSVRTYLINIDKPILSAYQIASSAANGGGHELASGFSLNLKEGFAIINNVKDYIQNLISYHIRI